MDLILQLVTTLGKANFTRNLIQISISRTKTVILNETYTDNFTKSNFHRSIA